MAKYWEDWRASTIGSAPTGWTKRWNLSSFNLQVVNDGVGPSGRALEISRSDTDRSCVTFDAVDSDANRADAKIRMLVKIASPGNNAQTFLGITARQAGAEGSETGIQGTLGQEATDLHGIENYGYDSGTDYGDSSYTDAASDVSWNADTYYWLGFDVSGTDVTVTLWPENDPGGTALGSKTETLGDTVTAAGGIGIFGFSGVVGLMHVAAFSVATGADAAFYSDPNANADFADGFVGAANTNLTDHTPDIGSAWTGGGTTQDNARLNGSGQLKCERNVGVHAIFADDLGSPDHQVWFQMHPTDVNNSRIAVRIDGTSNYGLAVAMQDGDVEITTRDGGSTSIELAHVHGLSYPFWLRLKADGDSISVYKSQNEPTSPEDDANWTLVDSFTNSTNNTVQTPGLLVFGTSSPAGTTNADPWIDNYRASALTGGGDTTAPSFDSAATDSVGDTVTVTFNEALDTGNDTASGEWTVDEDGSPITINSAAIDTGNTTDVVIELASAVAEGATVTVSYSGTSLRDAAGNQVASFTDEPVTNNVADTTSPTLSSAVVDDTALTLTYNEALDEASVPDTGDFTVNGSTSGTVSVSSVGVSGTDVTLTLSSSVTVDETVTIDYTPGTNPIQDTSGNDAASLTDEPVTNNTTNDLDFVTQFDGGSCHPTNTTITNAGSTNPTVLIVPRPTHTSSSTKWRNFFLRLTSANGKRPIFQLDDSDYVASVDSGWRAWYTEDDPESESATWVKFDTAWSTNGAGDLEWQHSTAFTADTVHVAFMPSRPVAREKSFIDWIVANHADKIHRLPSIGDNVNWSGGTLSDQTDELGRTVPGQPMYSFGLWDSTSYPSDGLPKRTVLLTSGLHGGEHVAGFALEGAIRWLLGGSSEANALLQNIQFIVMPCTNPMGRYGGHDRGQWDPADLNLDPNRDWTNFVLESTQLARDMLDKDSIGRRFIHHIDFHTAYFSASGYSAPAFYWAENNSTYLDQTYRTDWENLLQVYDAGYTDQSDSISTTHVRWSESQRDAPIYFIPELLPQYPVSVQSDWEVIGEHWMKTLNDWWNTYSSRVVFSGNYIATTLNGSATVSRKLDAAVYPWPPKPDDTPTKVERGLGADSSRNFRMDLGNITGEVFVVISSVDYESTNTDAAAGANIVTVSST